MRQPVWHFEVIRDTNAPFALVREALLDGQRYHLWHPRHNSAKPEIIEDNKESKRLGISYSNETFGISEEARYLVKPCDDDTARLLLTYKTRFKGWPVLILMGWWRVRSERIWERLIASLKAEEI